MENKTLKFQTLILTTLILASCTSTIPTDKALPSTIQPSAIVGIEEPVSSTPEAITPQAFLVGINEAGAEVYGSTGDLGIFSRFYMSQDKIVALRFYVSEARPHTDESVPTSTSILTSQWRILIYRYRTDGSYSNQPAIEANLLTEVSLEELQAEFGDCKAFTYQLIDEQKALVWQGYFSMNTDSILVKTDTGRAMKEGAIIGYPYSLNENEEAFFHEGKSIVIHEPQSGFYRLFYVYNILLATPGLETNLSELTIRLFPYRDDSNYSVYDSPPIMEKILSGVGILTIELPIDSIRDNINGNNMYYLQIVDNQENIIKDDYFVFTASARQ